MLAIKEATASRFVHETSPSLTEKPFFVEHATSNLERWKKALGIVALRPFF